MQKANATTRLKESILVLESEQAATKKLLQEDFKLVRESFKPANLIKSSVKNIIGSAGGSIIDTSLGLTAGYLSKKIMVGSSSNPLLRIAGSFLQFGVSTLVMKNPEAIKSVGGFLLKKIFRKKKVETETST